MGRKLDEDDVIRVMHQRIVGVSESRAKIIASYVPTAEPTPFTDREKRIFLAAMGREEKVCEEVDRNYVREPYEDSLMNICREIKRKVKGTLWGEK